jgi:hypothetical protein
MNHDDGDWDSELGEGLIDIVVELGCVGWVGLVAVLVGVGLLVFHFVG